MNNKELQVLQSIVSKDQYDNIQALLNHTKQPNTYPFVAEWIEKTLPISINDNELILAAINEELKTQGIECIFDDDGKKLFSYCNTGDEFGLTVMYYWPKEKFIISTFINIIEALEENMLEIFIND